MTQASLPLEQDPYPHLDPEHDLYSLLKEEFALEVPSETGKVPEAIAARMANIRTDLFAKTGGLQAFTEAAGTIIRNAVDYVIDAPTLLRLSVDDLEPDEKTAVGKRIERMLRFKFDIPRGDKLDIVLGGEDVDIKTTMTNKWMFSKSSWNHVNLLIAYDEKKARFSVGLTFVVEAHLGAKNRDSKRTIKKEFYENISWIVEGASYPPNFLADLPADTIKQITSQSSPNERVDALFALVQKTPIPRHAICSIANQQDSLKRLRRNGGARETLWMKGILVLSGTSKSDKAIAQAALGIRLGKGEFASLSRNHPSLTVDMLKSYMEKHEHEDTGDV